MQKDHLSFLSMPEAHGSQLIVARRLVAGPSGLAIVSGLHHGHVFDREVDRQVFLAELALLREALPGQAEGSCHLAEFQVRVRSEEWEAPGVAAERATLGALLVEAPDVPVAQWAQELETSVAVLVPLGPLAWRFRDWALRGVP